jgi:hypothetical protein
MSDSPIDIIKRRVQDARSHPSHPYDSFRDSVMESVLKAVPETSSRWERAVAAGRKSLDAVKDGIRVACEVSVALASSKDEAERHISEAGSHLRTSDNEAMGRHLESRIGEIDAEVSRRERDGWSATSPEVKEFVSDKFAAMCRRLDAASRDEDLRNHCPELRKALFPKVCASEYRRDSARGQLRHCGDKGLSDTLASSVGKSAAAAAAGEHKQGGSLRAGSSTHGLRREDSPNVCMR